MITPNTNNPAIDAAVNAQTINDFKNAAMIVSITLNLAILMLWTLAS